MRDLIDRQALIDDLLIADVREVQQFCYPCKKILDAIKAQPSAQQTTCKYWDTESDFCALYRPSAQPEIFSTPSYSVSTGEPVEYVQIIRCKDCKYYVSSGWCEGIGTCVSTDDFCSRAERRST